MPHSLKRAYGWKRDQPDFRDFVFLPHHEALTTLPLFTNNRAKAAPVVNQLDLGACTANMGAVLFAYILAIQAAAKGFVAFSRLALYYATRKLEGTTKSDSGATIRDTFKTLGNVGVCPESDWPYVVSKFAVAPPKTAVADEAHHKGIQYLSVAQTPLAIRSALAQGYAVGFGFSVYAGFESDEVAASGVVAAPKKGEKYLGGHANIALDFATVAYWREAYADKPKVIAALAFFGPDEVFYLCQNSWGEDWGIDGFWLMEAIYLENPKMASDLWVLEKVSG